MNNPEFDLFPLGSFYFQDVAEFGTNFRFNCVCDVQDMGQRFTLFFPAGIFTMGIEVNFNFFLTQCFKLFRLNNFRLNGNPAELSVIWSIHANIRVNIFGVVSNTTIKDEAVLCPGISILEEGTCREEALI